MPRQKKQILKQRKDGRYCCRYHGIQFMGDTSDEALAAREAYKKAEAQHELLTRTEQTVYGYAAEWLPIHKAGVKASTYNSYVSVIEHAITPISSLPLQSVTTDDIARVYAALVGRSESYIHKVKILLTELFDSAVDAGFLARNPCRAKSVKAPKGSVGTHRAVTPAERSAIERTPHRMQLAALIMLYCGLRRGELLGLQAQDIQGEELTVRRAVFYVGNQPEISLPKTRNGVRIVPAPDFILSKLQKMNGDCYVLTGTKKPMTEQVFTRAWSNYCRDIGISIRCHDLRHSYCTWLRDSGVDIHQAIIWMGHADEKLILRVYDHPGTEREKEAKNRLKTALNMQNDMQKQQAGQQTRAE